MTRRPPAPRPPALRSSGRLALLALAIAAASPGCDDDPGAVDPVDRFTEVLPDSELLALEVPGESDLAMTDAPLAIIEAPLVGEPSSLRALTGSVRRYLRSLIDNLLDGVDRMTATRPILRSEDRAVWHRRFVAEQHEKALVMQKQDGHFAFSLWIRPLTAAGATPAPWRFLSFGRLTPTETELGRGAMWIDLDNDRHPRSRGKMSVLWSLIGDRREIEVLVFDGTPDDGEIGRLTRSFRYLDGPDGGLLAFDAGEVDVHRSAERTGKERVRVFSRWNAARLMRADYAATGPEVRSDGFRVLIGSECWRPPEGDITYETRVAVPLGDRPPLVQFERGDRQSCAFSTEEPPIVAPPGTPPTEPPPPEELDLR